MNYYFGSSRSDIFNMVFDVYPFISIVFLVFGIMGWGLRRWGFRSTKLSASKKSAIGGHKALFN
jgi:hypothetical protein